MFDKKETSKIELGDEAKDRISGFSGIVVATTEWLHACRRITIQPKELKDGLPMDNHTFDEPQIELTRKQGYGQPLAAERDKTGGPSIAPTRQADPV
ncbi:MAG: hypothetical protein GY788_07440 [bacterium]|nr:hypothetical protein [bacterium]